MQRILTEEEYQSLVKKVNKFDNCIGSGSTAVACINTNRKYIGFELDTTYCGLAENRILHIA